MSSTEALAGRLAELRERIARAAARSGRSPDDVTLVGVAKRQPASAVAAAVSAGLTWVGESFVQEATRKIPEVEALLESFQGPPPRWTFVGRLQRNKARQLIALCDSIESVDRIELAQELDRRAGPLGRTLDVLLQVNTSGEPQKGGVAPAALPELLAQCRALGSLRVRGLMTVPAASTDPQALRASFASLRELRDAQEAAEHLNQLSMGMSADFEIAIEEGATRVRVGTALFGPRES